MVKGGLPLFGHVFDLLHGSAWDLMTDWMIQYGTVFKFHLFGSDMICISDPEILKIMLSTKLSMFKKDTLWTYRPFMVDPSLLEAFYYVLCIMFDVYFSQVVFYLCISFTSLPRDTCTCEHIHFAASIL